MKTATSTQENNSPMATQTFPIKPIAQSGPQAPGAQVHKLLKQELKPRDSVALKKVKTPHNGRTSVMSQLEHLFPQ